MTASLEVLTRRGEYRQSGNAPVVMVCSGIAQQERLLQEYGYFGTTQPAPDIPMRAAEIPRIDHEQHNVRVLERGERFVPSARIPLKTDPFPLIVHGARTIISIGGIGQDLSLQAELPAQQNEQGRPRGLKRAGVLFSSLRSSLPRLRRRTQRA